MGGASNQKRLFQERADTSDKLCFNFCQFFFVSFVSTPEGVFSGGSSLFTSINDR